ncbi:MAG: hypothetical protein GQ522_03815 [Deltaproteobacteria bacterium]|jgi:hypothetical protein|nr:hypothetical protein [Deltaproteobacteria bacterium]
MNSVNQQAKKPSPLRSYLSLIVILFSIGGSILFNYLEFKKLDVEVVEIKERLKKNIALHVRIDATAEHIQGDSNYYGS